MMDTIVLAKYVLSINPDLKVGNYDNNLKLNKLLYFSSLMYFSVFKENLINNSFERWDNGPVIRDVYIEFRYHDLISNSERETNVVSDKEKTIIQIVNFIYGNKTSNELSEETHLHNIWRAASRNERLDFQKLNSSIIAYMKNLYSVYQTVDLENLHKEVINRNTYLYYDDMDLTSEDYLNVIQQVAPTEFPIFLEILDGELVFS
ncbi:Panacea domain-containing protein [Streptococcus mitis]|uniref:Panacea domain-containing protein n=1 Tax=Streptococcus mitis TaxID=28037 RepID=UPI00098B74EF|nr:type II toxin-antitoxin system antitoxin SocA domain-containing protein [Streptococcus mitis]